MDYSTFIEILKRTIKDFKEISNIGYIATFGSLKMERDIDLIVAPEKNIKKGAFLKTLSNFLEMLSKYLDEKGARLIVAMHSLVEEEVKYLSNRKVGKDVLLHISSFPDFITLESLSKGILKNANKIYGNKKTVEDIPQTDREMYYKYLLFSNCLYSHYPKKLEIDKIREKIAYIYKHNKGKIDFQNKTNKQIYFECCDFLDKTAKNI